MLKQKKEAVSGLAARIKKAKTIALINLSALPDSLLQSMRKKLRGKAEIVIAKNALISRAFEQAGKGKELLPHMTGPTALVFTDMNPFELFREFKRSTKQMAAKPGQTAPSDIVVPEGETTLPPGPALSELKNAKIDARIQAGKIVVARDSIVAEKGQKITHAAAKALQTLGIRPFEVGIDSPAIIEAGIVYRKSVLDVDEKQLAADIAAAASAAFNLSVEIAYVTKDNIVVLLGKAHRQAKGLGVEAKIFDSGVIEDLLAQGQRSASAIKTALPETPSPTAEATPTGEQPAEAKTE
ncbi:MAG: 50S ribosomal protein L10 [Candidatus Micrarchaeota archaeon]|nr:50S ribosomal protein L10 [Candidatus Micrarchaeota archaeon]